MTGPRPEVFGAVVDAATRCVHWHGELDVIAIRFRCCGRFYPCHECHAESADHPATTWPVTERDQPAVLCGVCGTVLTVAQYLAAGDRCPSCSAGFNPGCRLHRRHYFA